MSGESSPRQAPWGHGSEGQGFERRGPTGHAPEGHAPGESGEPSGEVIEALLDNAPSSVDLTEDGLAPPAEERSITRRQSLVMMLSSVVVAASALLVQMIAVKTSGTVSSAEFLVFWSVLFGVIGVVAGIQQEVTRAVGTARIQRNSPRGARVFPVALCFGIAVAVLLAISAPWWAMSQMPTNTPFAVAMIGLGAILASIQFAMSGAAAGTQRWYLFAGLTGGEALLRLGSVLIVALGVGTLAGLQAAVVAGLCIWALLLVVSPTARATAAARGDARTSRLARNIVISMGSSTASAVLMIGFPALLSASEGGHLDAHQALVVGALGYAISVTRSPIMIPLQAFQGVFIAAFLKSSHRPIAALMRPSALMLGIAAVGSVLAWAIGPWLFGLLFKKEYLEVATGPLLGALVFASGVLALLVLSGAATLALNIHKVFILGWVLAAVVAMIMLFFLPTDLVPRALIALYAGPALGFSVHLTGMVMTARKRRVEAEEPSPMSSGDTPPFDKK